MCAPEAISITEAPETVTALYKQRFRWNYGTLQCLWKHRRTIGRGTVGWIAIPNMLLFQFLLPLLAPFGDIVFLLSLCQKQFGLVAVSYILFLLMDLAASTIAFREDRRSLSGLWIVLAQRFYYRQFMYAVVAMAVLAALRGGRHGWNKLLRSGRFSTAPALAV